MEKNQERIEKERQEKERLAREREEKEREEKAKRGGTHDIQKECGKRLNRKYPPIKSGSNVRVLLKPSTFKKSWHDRWSAETHKIIRIQGKYYLLNDNKRTADLRHELLLS